MNLKATLKPSYSSFYKKKGVAFIKAYAILEKNGGYYPVALYNLCLGIELCLKSFLLKHGVSIDELREKQKYGHNLDKLVVKCSEITKTKMTDEEQNEMRHLNNSYRHKEGRYSSDMDWTFRGVKVEFNNFLKYFLKITENGTI